MNAEWIIGYRSPCECNANGTQATTANPGRSSSNTANTTPAVLASTGQTVPCTCANQMIGGNSGNAFNMNAASFDGSALNSGDPLLSSNAKFQAISAIAVSQDGVINVADQGKFERVFLFDGTRGDDMEENSCENAKRTRKK